MQINKGQKISHNHMEHPIFNSGIYNTVEIPKLDTGSCVVDNISTFDSNRNYIILCVVGINNHASLFFYDLFASKFLLEKTIQLESSLAYLKYSEDQDIYLTNCVNGRIFTFHPNDHQITRINHKLNNAHIDNILWLHHGYFLIHCRSYNYVKGFCYGTYGYYIGNIKSIDFKAFNILNNIEINFNSSYYDQSTHKLYIGQDKQNMDKNASLYVINMENTEKPIIIQKINIMEEFSSNIFGIIHTPYLIIIDEIVKKIQIAKQTYNKIKLIKRIASPFENNWHIDHSHFYNHATIIHSHKYRIFAVSWDMSVIEFYTIQGQFVHSIDLDTNNNAHHNIKLNHIKDLNDVKNLGAKKDLDGLEKDNSNKKSDNDDFNYLKNSNVCKKTDDVDLNDLENSNGPIDFNTDTESDNTDYNENCENDYQPPHSHIFPINDELFGVIQFNQLIIIQLSDSNIHLNSYINK